VVLHVPTALTEYRLVPTEGLTVKVFEGELIDWIGAPPHEFPLYKFQLAPVPKEPFTVIMLDCPIQIEVGLAVTVLIDDVVFIVIVSEAQAVGVTQPPSALT
jgi:hypothetical protein